MLLVKSNHDAVPCFLRFHFGMVDPIHMSVGTRNDHTALMSALNIRRACPQDASLADRDRATNMFSETDTAARSWGGPESDALPEAEQCRFVRNVDCRLQSQMSTHGHKLISGRYYGAPAPLTRKIAKLRALCSKSLMIWPDTHDD